MFYVSGYILNILLTYRSNRSQNATAQPPR